MTLKWYGDQFDEEINRKVGRGLAACAVLFQTWHKQKLNKSNPHPHKNPSQRGEYPRARSGFGRDATVYDPISPEQMAEKGFVMMGYLVNAWYMAYLEVYQDRLGLLKSLEDLKPRMQAILTSIGKGK